MTGRTFLTICIPLSLVIYSCIPPVVLLASTFLLAPAKFEELHNWAAAYLPSSEPEEPEVVHTKQGCTCKFPFTYAGKTHTKCIMLDGVYLVGEASGTRRHRAPTYACANSSHARCFAHCPCPPLPSYSSSCAQIPSGATLGQSVAQPTLPLICRTQSVAAASTCAWMVRDVSSNGRVSKTDCPCD